METMLVLRGSPFQWQRKCSLFETIMGILGENVNNFGIGALIYWEMREKISLSLMASG